MTDNPKDVEAVKEELKKARLMSGHPVADGCVSLHDLMDAFTGYRKEPQTLDALVNELSEGIALAAIKAHTECLMEPSEEMRAAGEYVLSEGDAVWIFQAMLSAKEKTNE